MNDKLSPTQIDGEIFPSDEASQLDPLGDSSRFPGEQASAIRRTRKNELRDTKNFSTRWTHRREAHILSRHLSTTYPLELLSLLPHKTQQSPYESSLFSSSSSWHSRHWCSFSFNQMELPPFPRPSSVSSRRVQGMRGPSRSLSANSLLSILPGSSSSMVIKNLAISFLPGNCFPCPPR